MTFTDYDSPQDESAVSLEDLEAYLAKNTRPILQPLIEDQQRVTAPFQAGTSGAAPVNVDETAGGPNATNPAPHLPAGDQPEATDASGAENVETAGNEPAPGGPTGEPAADDAANPFGLPTPAAEGEQDETIEVSPGVFMTREAIAAALQRPEPQIPAGGDGSATGEPTSAPVAPPAAAAPAAQEPAAQVTEPPAAPAQFQIPQELLDDPELAPFVNIIRGQQATLDQQQAAITTLHDITVNREMEAIQSRVAAGITRFKTEKSLDDEAVHKINMVAANLQIMPSLASGTDPLTGQTIPRDPEQAAYRALEIAFWQMPEYREAAIQQEAVNRAKDSKRKQRLAGVSSGNGSVARTRTVPTDRRGRELAAVADLREMMNPGQGEE